jgi:hypothetical protein
VGYRINYRCERGPVKKFLRLITAFAITFAALVTPVNQASAFPTSLTEIGQRAVKEIGDCVNSKRKLEVFYLVDGSGSLKDTDPQNLRSEVLASSLEQLAPTDNSIQVRYAVGTFGSKYRSLKGWSELTSENATSESNWFRKNIPALIGEGNTNWEAGLQGANAALVKARNANSSSCQVVVWLTDGGIDLGVSSTSFDAEQESLQRICGIDPGTGAGSTGDAQILQLRNSGVNIIGVLLRDEAFMEALKKKNSGTHDALNAQMTFLQPIVEGTSEVDGRIFGSSATRYSCGGAISPSQAAGAELVASDSLQLSLQFARVIARSNNGSPTSVFGDNPAQFIIDPGIAYFDLLVSSKNWALQDPTGKVVSSPTTGIKPKLVAGAYLVRVPVSGNSQQGKWSIQNTTHTEADVFLYSGLTMKVNATSVTVGKPTDIKGQILDVNGQPANLTIYGSNSLRVTSFNSTKGVDSEVPLTLDPASGTFSGTFQPPKGVSQAQFDIALTLTTKSGIKLTPLTQQIEARVGLPPEYPQIQGSGVVLSTLSGTSGKATGILVLEGSNVADGQVCLQSPQITIDPKPSRISSFVWNEAGNGCIDIAKGTTKEIKYSVSNKTQSDGQSSGVIPASFKTNMSGLDPIEQDIAVNFDSKVKVNELVRWLILIGLILLGLALPLGILYFFGYRNSRILWGEGIQRVMVPVTLNSAGTISRRDGKTAEGMGPGAQKREYDWHTQSAERLRSITDSWSDGINSGTVEIKGRASRNPFGDPVVIATASEGTRLISSLGGITKGGREGRVGVDIASAWYVAVPESEIRDKANNGGTYKATAVSFIRHDASRSSQATDRNTQIGTNSGLNNIELIEGAIQNEDAKNSSTESNKSGKTPKDKKRKKGGKAEATTPVTEETNPFASGGTQSTSGSSYSTGTTTTQASDANPFAGTTPPPAQGGSSTNSDPFGGNY